MLCLEEKKKIEMGLGSEDGLLNQSPELPNIQPISHRSMRLTGFTGPIGVLKHSVTITAL